MDKTENADNQRGTDRCLLFCFLAMEEVKRARVEFASVTKNVRVGCS